MCTLARLAGAAPSLCKNVGIDEECIEGYRCNLQILREMHHCALVLGIGLLGFHRALWSAGVKFTILLWQLAACRWRSGWHCVSRRPLHCQEMP